MDRNKLEEPAEKFTFYKFFGGVINSLGDRIKRRYENIGKFLGDELKKGNKLPENSNLTANLFWSDRAPSYARKITLAFEEFKQVNPDAYKQLEEIINKHRKIRRAMLNCSVKKYNPQEEDYVGIISDLIDGIDSSEARNLYREIENVGKKLGKSATDIQTFLLPE